MTKAVFRKHAIISSALTVIAIAIIIAFCVIMFDKYSQPSENNTSVISGKVASVFIGTGSNHAVIVEMSNGDLFQLVYPWTAQELYTTVGYNGTQLAVLLEGKDIRCRRMNELPWVVEIYVDDIVIDNCKLTAETITSTRVAIVVLGIIMLAFPIAGEISYIEPRYKSYAKTEKKRTRKLKRDVKSGSK